MEGGDRFEYISLGGAVESRRPARPGPNRPPGFRMPRIGGIEPLRFSSASCSCRRRRRRRALPSESMSFLPSFSESNERVGKGAKVRTPVNDGRNRYN